MAITIESLRIDSNGEHHPNFRIETERGVVCVSERPAPRPGSSTIREHVGVFPRQQGGIHSLLLETVSAPSLGGEKVKLGESSTVGFDIPYDVETGVGQRLIGDNLYRVHIDQ